jgi:hypothetical protein
MLTGTKLGLWILWNLLTYNKFIYFGQAIEDEDDNDDNDDDDDSNNNKRLWIHSIDLFQAAAVFISPLVKGSKRRDAKPTRGCSRL